MAVRRSRFNTLPLSVLQPLLANYITCLTNIAVAGQSHTIGQRSFTQADIEQVKATIEEVQSAIDYQTGRLVGKTYGSVNRIY